MNTPNDQSKKNFWKKIIAIMVIGSILITAVYIGKQYKDSQKTAKTIEFYNQLSDETYIEFAKQLETSIHNQNPEAFDTHVDLASLFNFSTRELTKSYHKRKLIEILQPQLKIGNTISAELVNSNDFKYTKFYKENGVPHIVFRLYHPDFINFLDFTLGIKKEKIVITDMYNFYTGVLFSEMASETYYKIMNEPDALTSTIKTYKQVEKYLEQKNYEEAYALLTAVPLKQRNPFHYPYLLSVASSFDNDTYIKIINDIKAEKLTNQRLQAFFNFYKNIVEGDLNALNITIANLETFVGSDAIFDLYRGIMFNYALEFEKAQPFFDRIITKLPDFYDGYYYKLHSLLSQNKQQEALSVVTKIKEKFAISEEDLTFEIQSFEEFTNSKAYQNIFKGAK